MTRSGTPSDLAAIADLQSALAGHRQAWDSVWPKAVTFLHAGAAFLGQENLLRGLGAAARN